MFDTASKTDLAQLLNHFRVPMFAVERAGSDTDFRVVCINQKHSELSGFAPETVAGSTLHEILPETDAARILNYCETCARLRSEVRYFESVDFPKGRLRLDTSLQHVPLPNGGDRILGMSITASSDHAQPRDIGVLDDIRYFSALADLQLSNLMNALEGTQAKELFGKGQEDRADRLRALCRGANRAVGDIRDRVASPMPRDKIARSAGTSSPEPGSKAFGGQVMQAIFDTVAQPDDP